MSAVFAVMRRELRSYFVTPLAWVFSVIFLILAAALTFYLGHFYERGQADLQPFFNFHPWLYLFLVPALSMQMWAEERKRGTLELLLTLPITATQAMLGKFFAAWMFVALVLALTFPIWLTVNYLGDPDNGVILAGYLGSLLMAGAYLAVGCCMSTLTRSQVVAFVLTAAVCFLLLLAGQPLVMDAASGFLPAPLVQAVADMSFLEHFAAIARGVLDVRDMIYFVLSIVFWLAAGVIMLNMRRAS
ncbi:MAG TPA: ABC transporter permease subunit [Oleiagrimonas sp.]|nr:ABC transporter permease subunit [Oleiagrimonas sp.]